MPPNSPEPTTQTNHSPTPQPLRRTKLLDLRHADNLFQGIFTLSCGLGLAFAFRSIDWSRRLWLIGELIAPFSFFLGLIIGLLAGVFISGLILLLIRRGN